ncbi:hypothetical protein [Geobacillus sp. FSL K6-3411]
MNFRLDIELWVSSFLIKRIDDHVLFHRMDDPRLVGTANELNFM